MVFLVRFFIMLQEVSSPARGRSDSCRLKISWKAPFLVLWERPVSSSLLTPHGTVARLLRETTGWTWKEMEEEEEEGKAGKEGERGKKKQAGWQEDGSQRKIAMKETKRACGRGGRQLGGKEDGVVMREKRKDRETYLKSSVSKHLVAPSNACPQRYWEKWPKLKQLNCQSCIMCFSACAAGLVVTCKAESEAIIHSTYIATVQRQKNTC